jgi:hypothetical protein
MKLTLVVCLIISSAVFSQENGRVLDGGVSTGGGGSRVINGDITTGGGRFRNIQLLKIKETSAGNFSLDDARPMLRKVFENNVRPEITMRMMKIKVMADLNSISEITLKDGTVIKAEELIR